MSILPLAWGSHGGTGASALLNQPRTVTSGLFAGHLRALYSKSRPSFLQLDELRIRRGRERDHCSRSQSKSVAKEHYNSELPSPEASKHCKGAECLHSTLFPLLLSGGHCVSCRVDSVMPACRHSFPLPGCMRGPSHSLHRAPRSTICSRPPTCTSLLLNKTKPKQYS